jgi:hypothetical protein
MSSKDWKIHNPSGSKRIIVTKVLPGTLWLERLVEADCEVEVCTSEDVLSVVDVNNAIGQLCNAVLGQLTEDWGNELFGTLKADGGTAIPIIVPMPVCPGYGIFWRRISAPAARLNIPWRMWQSNLAVSPPSVNFS